MSNKQSRRLSLLPPYLFVEIDRKKQAAIQAGRDVIDFGIGDPDLPTHAFILDRMAAAIRTPANHRYQPSAGTLAFRQTVADYMKSRFGVALDPASEIASVLGTKEAIGHLPTALVNPGEVVLVPEPGYPVYTSGTIFAGGESHVMPLAAQHGWLPRLDRIPPDICARAKLMYLNYPNNPTGARAPLSFYEEAVAFARRYDIVIAHDAAYAETYFEQPPPSIFQIAGAKDLCIELHSLSKTFNMTGWRVGFACGDRDLVAALVKVKSNLDSGIFGAVQEAGIEALNGLARPEIKTQLETYRKRRDILVKGLGDAGWKVKPPPATFYLWVQCPPGQTSMEASTRLLAEAGVVAVPGEGFGASGAGYLRFALTVNEQRTREAVERIAKIPW